MKVITAKILDSIHLELTQQIFTPAGQFIQISILDGQEEDNLWQTAAKRHFLEAYADEDAIYDKL